MAKNILQIINNTKTRTLVLLTGGIFLVGVIVAILSSGKTGEPLENRPSKTSEIPYGIESTPGAQTSKRYRELQKKANIAGAKTAEKKGDTFIPTIVSEKKEDSDVGDFQSQFLKAFEQLDDTTSKAKGQQDKVMQQDPRLARLLAQQQQDKKAEEDLLKQRQAQLDTERMITISEQKLKAIDTVAQAMEEQVGAAFDAWGNVPQQTYIIGNWEAEKEKRDQEAATMASSAGAIDSRPVVLKAGTVLFAVLETSINSDEPGPIMAKVVQGAFKDAKLIGKIEAPPTADGEKLTLRFSTLNVPGESTSSTVSAVAIDPDTARTALASDVDHHYLLRWGSLFASAFMEGYAKAVGESGTSVATATVAGQTTTTTNKQALSGRQQVFEGLGTVGERWSEQIGKNFSRKPTIKIDSGSGLGILLIEDLKLGPAPQKETTINTTMENNQQGRNPVELLNKVVENAATIADTMQQQKTTSSTTATQEKK